MFNLIRRTVTGAFIVIFVLGGLWLHPISFFIVGAVMIAGTQHEYYIMVRDTGTRPQLVTGIITGFLLYFTATMVAVGWFPRQSLPGPDTCPCNRNGHRAFQKGRETV